MSTEAAVGEHSELEANHTRASSLIASIAHGQRSQVNAYFAGDVSYWSSALFLQSNKVQPVTYPER
jgi:hypothetical protein